MKFGKPVKTKSQARKMMRRHSKRAVRKMREKKWDPFDVKTEINFAKMFRDLFK